MVYPNVNIYACFYKKKPFSQKLTIKQVRRAGFAYRVDFFDFIGRFKVIGAGRMDMQVLAHGSDFDICKNLVDTSIPLVPMLKNKGEVQMGKSKIFIKTPETFFELQKLRKKMVNHQVVKIQTVFRRFAAKRDLVFLRAEMASVWEENGKEPTAADLLRPFQGTYLVHEDKKLQFTEILEFYQSNDVYQERIQYSDEVRRLNKAKKWDTVVLAVTDKALYICEWKMLKSSPEEVKAARKAGKAVVPEYRLDLIRRTELKDMDAISLSRMADDVMVIMCKPMNKKIKPNKSDWVKKSTISRCMETQEKFSFFGKVSWVVFTPSELDYTLVTSNMEYSYSQVNNTHSQFHSP